MIKIVFGASFANGIHLLVKIMLYRDGNITFFLNGLLAKPWMKITLSNTRLGTTEVSDENAYYNALNNATIDSSVNY